MLAYASFSLCITWVHAPNKSLSKYIFSCMNGKEEFRTFPANILVYRCSFCLQGWLSSAKFMIELILSLFTFSTFGGNPLAGAVALASLDVIIDENLAERYILIA